MCIRDRIVFLVVSGKNGCYCCAVHFFRPFFTTTMLVWLPGTALVTTALCWLPGRCWSYSQYSLENCYATEYFWYWRRYINSWRLWDLVFGIRNLVWDLEVFVGIRNSVWGFRKCLESLWHCNTISRSLRREDIDSCGKILAQGGYCLCIWMDEEFGIAPYRVQSRDDVDCTCTRYDDDGW